MPWLTRENGNISSVRKLGELTRVVQSDDFDRIIVGREFDLSHWAPIVAASYGLAVHRGLFVYFPRAEGDAWTFAQNLDFAFGVSTVRWNINTTFGQVIMVYFGRGYML